MSRKEYSSIRLSKEVINFLNDCKHKTRSKSVEQMIRRVGGTIWEACEQIEREYNAHLFMTDHEGDMDYYVYQPFDKDRK